MYQVGEYIICGNNGVCKVQAVGPIKMGMGDKEYYTLTPVYSRGSKVFTPVDNQKMKMRPILTKDEAEELIDKMVDLEELWIPEEKKREAVYKEAMSSCDSEEWVRIIKTLHCRRETRLAQGKKVTSSDERYFHMAEESLYGELALALDMDKSEMESFIINKIENTISV